MKTIKTLSMELPIIAELPDGYYLANHPYGYSITNGDDIYSLRHCIPEEDLAIEIKEAALNALLKALHETLESLRPNAIAHMAMHNKSGNREDWHPDHQKIMDDAELLVIRNPNF